MELKLTRRHLQKNEFFGAKETIIAPFHIMFVSIITKHFLLY